MNGRYFTSFDGAKIYYHKTVRNKDKWLIFLHGFGGDLTAWQKERAYFTKQGISTIAMDLRGHGLSERSSNQDFYKLENFAKDLAALINTEELTNTIIVGHCFGGMVSIYFQALLPNHSQGLVLVDTSFKPPFFSYNPVEKALLKQVLGLFLELAPDIKTAGHRDFQQFAGTGDFDIKRILSDIRYTSLRSYLEICKNLVDLDAKKLLSQITIPTLIVEGESDSVFPPKVAKYLNQRIKKSQLDFIPEANHILVLNNPKDLQKSIKGFLTKIRFISEAGY